MKRQALQALPRRVPLRVRHSRSGDDHWLSNSSLSKTGTLPQGVTFQARQEPLAGRPGRALLALTRLSLPLRTVQEQSHKLQS